MMGVYKPREEASEWNLSCQHFNLWPSSLQNNEKFLLFSHPVYAINILLWKSKLMQRDNERSIVSLFFFSFLLLLLLLLLFSFTISSIWEIRCRADHIVWLESSFVKNRYVIDEYTSAFGEILWLVQENQYSWWIKEIDSESNLSGFEL